MFHQLHSTEICIFHCKAYILWKSTHLAVVILTKGLLCLSPKAVENCKRSRKKKVVKFFLYPLFNRFVAEKKKITKLIFKLKLYIIMLCETFFFITKSFKLIPTKLIEIYRFNFLMEKFKYITVSIIYSFP